MAKSIWSDINTCVEIGLEIYKFIEDGGQKRASSKEMTAEKMADGVMLMSNDEGTMFAVRKDIANQALSDTAVSYGMKKDDWLLYDGTAAAVPLSELSKVNDSVRGYIVNEESLRATLCVNYPEYVKTHNMNAPPGERIEDADAPPYLFLQKQLDNAANSTRIEVAEYQHTQNNEADREHGLFDDVLELER